MTAGDVPTDMPAGHFHLLRAVDVRQKSQTEALLVAGVREAVHCERGLLGMESFTYSRVQLVVGDGAPELRLFVGDGLELCRVVCGGGGLVEEIEILFVIFTYNLSI